MRAALRRLAGRAAAALLVGCLASPAAAAEGETPAGSIDAAALVERAAACLGGGRSFLSARLTVPGSRLGGSRDYRFQLFEDRPRRRAFLRISEPAKNAGTGYLWLAPVGWAWVPDDGMPVRLDREGLAAPWLDGDFTLADLLLGGADIRSARHRVLRVLPAGPGGQGAPIAVIESVATAGKSPWARIVHWIEVERATPLRREYFDAEGDVTRELRFSDVREVQGRFVPHAWEMGPEGKRKRISRIDVETIRFDADFEEVVFTTRYLVSGE